jgi:hypothetical protein
VYILSPLDKGNDQIHINLIMLVEYLHNLSLYLRGLLERLKPF